MTAVLETPALRDAIDSSANAAAARAVLERVIDSHPTIAGDLEKNQRLRDALVAIACASRSLSTAVVREPAMLVDAVRDDAFTGESDEGVFSASWARFTEDGDPLARLRRWKQRELLRVAARDLLGVADLPTVGRELAALAAVCLAVAVDLAGGDEPIAVVGMGKLGGRELNYASDVDVLFVHEGDADRAERAARAVLGAMRDQTADGIVFRTDANLRPEGRSGPLSRSLDSYEAYWERWARTWEFQALIKTRPVAGDDDLGRRFVERAGPHVWPDVLDPDAVREVRAMKARSESETDRRGVGERELKRGRGGIRDIEFAVQLLQMVHGRGDESVRAPNTLDALRALADADYLEAHDAKTLDDAYRYLRTVEHRLQLYDEQQTHTVPADTTARTRLARVLGYRDRGEESALARFDADHRARLTQVRSIHERVFFAPILDTLAGAGALSIGAAEERLTAFGFLDIASTRAALRELAAGLSRRSRVMQHLMPVILEWLSRTPDPDLGLLQLRRLTEGAARSSTLATTFRDAPGAAERACRLLGSSRLLGDALRRQPDFIELLGDDDALARERTRDELVDEGLRTLGWRAGTEARREGLRRFKRRELLRIAARDVLGFAPLEVAARELAGLAEACVEAALRGIGPPEIPFAVVGMGRFGGGELSYASDIDVLFVYDGESAADFDRAERTAEALMREIGATTAEGQTFRIDANLRPEGKQGPLARSLSGFRTYYERWAQTWEFQSLVKARFVAGDAELGGRFLDLVEPFVYRDPFPDEEVREVRRMKARIERERIPAGEDPQFHLKLGRGSLSDVEFTVQLLQLRHGGADPELRTPATIEAIERLARAGLLLADDARSLEEAYRFCERARNARYLLTGRAGDALPTDGAEAERLARMLGYVHRPQASLRDDYRRVTRRARNVVERVFYGTET